MSEQPPPLPPTREQTAVMSAADRFNAAATKAKVVVVSLAGRSKAAAQIIADQAERTKLTQITLPNAYRTLGRHVHGAGSLRVDFADIYGKIDALLADIAKLTATGLAVEGLKEKAMAVAKTAKDKTHAQVLQLKLNHEYTVLGKAAFEKHGENSGPPNVLKPILNCLALLEALAAEIADVSKSEPGAVLTPNRIAIGGLAVAALLLLLVANMMFVGGRTDEGRVAPFTNNAVHDGGNDGRPPPANFSPRRTNLHNRHYTDPDYDPNKEITSDPEFDNAVIQEMIRHNAEER